MNFLQRHIPKLLLYLVMLGNLSFVNDPPEEEIPSNELPPLSLQSESEKEAYAQSDTDSTRAPSDRDVESLASTDSDSQEMDIAKATKSTHPPLAKNLSLANSNLNIIPYILHLIAAVLLTSGILLLLILRNFRKQNSKPQLSASVYTTLSDDQSHHTLHLDHHPLHLENHPLHLDSHPLQSTAIQQLERHAWEQYDTNPLQFCGYDADYLLSLSEDTPAWNTVIHEVIENSPLITQKGINSIGDCIFDTFYDTDTIELHCELLQPPKTRATGKAPKQRDAQKILEQLEKERTKAANHVFHQHILDLLNKEEEKTDAESTEAAKFTDSLLNRIEACKLAYRMMRCFSAKADYQSTSTSEAEAASSHFPAREAAFETSPSVENTSPSPSPSPSSATAQEEAARKIALKLQQIFHSKEGKFVKDFKARIQESFTTMEQTTVSAQEMSEKEKEEKAVKGIKAGIQASAPQIANQFAQAIKKSIAHVRPPSDANQSSSNVVNDLLQDRLATATKQLLVQACLHVLTHIQQATKWRGYGQRQRFDSS